MCGLQYSITEQFDPFRSLRVEIVVHELGSAFFGKSFRDYRIGVDESVFCPFAPFTKLFAELVTALHAFIIESKVIPWSYEVDHGIGIDVLESAGKITAAVSEF